MTRTCTRSRTERRHRGRRPARAGALAVPAAALLAALLAPVPPARAGAAADPQDVVRQTSNRVVSVLRDAALSSDEKRRRIEAIVDEQVDFETLSRLVLGQHWKELTPAQQQEFMREFRQHLSVTYGRNIDSYRNEDVRIVGGREEPRGDYTVLSRIQRSGGAEDVVVNYRLRQRDGQWRIIDIIVEGVSLVSNFRSQFQDIIAQRGAQRLIDLLREKNQKGEPLKAEPSARRPAASGAAGAGHGEAAPRPAERA